MTNVQLLDNEVVLYEGSVMSNQHKGSVNLTLTSHQIIVEQEKGFFKKEIILLDTLPLADVKFYGDVAQINQKGASVEIQTKGKNVTFSFSGLIEARKFTGKAIDAVTGTTVAERSSEKVKEAFDIIDDTLKMDTRETLKSALSQGLKGTLINGLNPKNKDK